MLILFFMGKIEPIEYGKEITEKICSLIASGQSVKKISELKGMPNADTIHSWVAKYPDFTEAYYSAIKVRVARYADEIADISDDDSKDLIDVDGKPMQNGVAVRRADIRIRTRQWMLERMLPERFGNKIAISGEIQHNHAVTVDDDVLIARFTGKAQGVDDGKGKILDAENVGKIPYSEVTDDE